MGLKRERLLFSVGNGDKEQTDLKHASFSPGSGQFTSVEMTSAPSARRAKTRSLSGSGIDVVACTAIGGLLASS
jgi:hypothetical protein